MKIYNFKQRIDQIVYFKILDYALIMKSKMVFVDRKEVAIEPAFKEIISPYIIKEERVLSWPGTDVYTKDKIKPKGNLMYVIEIDSQLIDKIKLEIPALWDWQSPDYPEDLSFLRADGRPWFVSITHEDDAYVELEDNELKAFTDYFGNDVVEYFKVNEDVRKYL